MFSPEGNGWTTATTVKTPKGVLAGGSHSEVGSRPCHQCSKSQEGAREPNKREDMGKTESGTQPLLKGTGHSSEWTDRSRGFLCTLTGL
jgi:hypothetical protein